MESVPVMQTVPSLPALKVTSDGRVFRVYKTYRQRIIPVFYEMNRRVDKHGYHRVGLCYSVSRLVAETYIPNPDNLPEVRHMNGVRNDDRVSNLEWGTRQQNTDDMVRHGTVRKGRQIPQAKLTDDMVREARRRRSLGETYHSIAEDMSVSRFVITRAITKKGWRHVD